jgi:hypothetical protein
MKTQKIYQVRVVLGTSTPCDKGILLAEFNSYELASQYLADNIDRYPNAFITTIYA